MEGPTDVSCEWGEAQGGRRWHRGGKSWEGSWLPVIFLKPTPFKIYEIGVFSQSHRTCSFILPVSQVFLSAPPHRLVCPEDKP